MDVENLNKTSKVFSHFHNMILHVEPNIVFKLFQHSPDYASQTTMPTEYRLKLLFLSVMRKLHVPLMMCYLTGTVSCIDPDKIRREYKEDLPLELIAQLKRILNHHNPTRFIGHVTEEQHRKYRACGNYTSVSNNMTKVEATLNKEERNKHVAEFLCWLEKFFPDL